MKVIDSEDWAWFLFEYEGNLYLDVNCNLSALSYDYMIELDEREQKQYKDGGREYLNKLAHDIQFSVPIAQETKSIYKGRDVSEELSELAVKAVTRWREGNDS